MAAAIWVYRTPRVRSSLTCASANRQWEIVKLNRPAGPADLTKEIADFSRRRGNQLLPEKLRPGLGRGRGVRPTKSEAILEQVPDPSVLAVEPTRKAGAEALHYDGKRLAGRADDEMDTVGHQAVGQHHTSSRVLGLRRRGPADEWSAAICG